MDRKESKAIIKSKKNNKTKREYIILTLIIIFIIIIDQISKIYISSIGEMNVISNVLRFNVTQNSNAAYGIGSNSTIMYVITNIIILGIIFKFITTQNEFIDKKLKIFLSFILAGGISNVIDRLFRGYVVEFIDIKQMINFPVLNIADIIITIGWIAVAAIFASFTVNEWKNNKEKDKIKMEDEDEKKD